MRASQGPPIKCSSVHQSEKAKAPQLSAARFTVTPMPGMLLQLPGIAPATLVPGTAAADRRCAAIQGRPGRCTPRAPAGLHGTPALTEEQGREEEGRIACHDSLHDGSSVDHGKSDKRRRDGGYQQGVHPSTEGQERKESAGKQRRDSNAEKKQADRDPEVDHALPRLHVSISIDNRRRA